jgi:hypothetical protein
MDSTLFDRGTRLFRAALCALWFTSTGLLLVLGGVVASVATASTALWTISIVVIAALLTQQVAPKPGVTTSWVDVVGRTLCISLVMWGFVGLVMLLGPMSVPIAVLLMVSAPPRLSLIAKVTSRFRPPPAPEPATKHTGDADPRPRSPDDVPTQVLVIVAADPRAVGQLTAPELCAAWRRSFLAFERDRGAGTIASQAALITLRQLYLDELERRDPVGFARWIASGARPASDPSRYLTKEPRRR